MDTVTLLPVLVAKVCEDAPTDVGGSICLSAKAADAGACAKHCCTKRKKLEGKVVVITGGAQGIGEETARVFVRNGACVVIADVEEEKGRKVAEDLGGAATYVTCDVSLEADVERAVKVAVALHGGVDVMFNNPGVLGEQQEKSIMDLDGDEMDMVMRVNVKGVALGMKMAAREMVRRGKGGCIISTASVAGVMGGLGPHSYTASKHAIVGLTKNAACELGRYGIRVNCISPFGVATDMLVRAWNPIASPSDVEKTEERVRGLGNLKGPTLRATDIAHAALYLATDDAAYVSGHNLVVDGGVTSVYNCIGL